MLSTSKFFANLCIMNNLLFFHHFNNFTLKHFDLFCFLCFLAQKSGTAVVILLCCFYHSFLHLIVVSTTNLVLLCLVLLSPLPIIFLISWFLTFVVINGCCIWRPSHCGPAACIFPCSVTLRVLSRCLPLSSSIPLCCGVLQATAVPSQPFFWLSLFIACFSIFLGSW